MNRKLYVHKSQINLFRTLAFGTCVEEISIRLAPKEGWVECNVEVPERIANITESQFEEAFRSEGDYLTSHTGVVGRIREKFFGAR